MATADLPALADMTLEAKRELLGALLLDLSAGGDLLSVEAGGRTFNVYAPPADAREEAEQLMLECTPEELDELVRRANDPDPGNWVTAEELIRQLREEDGPPPSSPEPSASGGGRAEPATGARPTTPAGLAGRRGG